MVYIITVPVMVVSGSIPKRCLFCHSSNQPGFESDDVFPMISRGPNISTTQRGAAYDDMMGIEGDIV